jgi:hypothetical protein
LIIAVILIGIGIIQSIAVESLVISQTEQGTVNPQYARAGYDIWTGGAGTSQMWGQTIKINATGTNSSIDLINFTVAGKRLGALAGNCKILIYGTNTSANSPNTTQYANATIDITALGTVTTNVTASLTGITIKDNVNYAFIVGCSDNSMNFGGYGKNTTSGYADGIAIHKREEDAFWVVLTTIVDYYFVLNYQLAGSDSINITGMNPANNTQYGSATIPINATVIGNNNFNCSLYVNNTLNETITSFTQGTNAVNFTKTFADGEYRLIIGCFDNLISENSTEKKIFIDSTLPSVTISGNNTYWTNNISFSVNATDIFLKSIMINSSCSPINYSNSSITSPYVGLFNFSTMACALGNHNINITVCDSANGTINHCANSTIFFDNMAMIRINATSIMGGSVIASFSIYKNGTLGGSTTSGNYNLTNLTIGSYNLTIDAGATYEVKSAIINITTAITNQSFYLFGTNSINITIYDEVTNVILNATNITIMFEDNSSVFTNYTYNGTFYIDNLNPAVYTIKFYNTNYSLRTYTVTVGNRTSQNLNAYMIVATYSTIFTVYDQDTSQALENVSFSIYKQSGGGWSLVQSTYSDISGKVQFYYSPLLSYRFYLTKTDYEDNLFYLNPILFSSYDIQMSKSVIIDYSQDFDGVSIIYSPSYFYDNNASLFTFIISSPPGTLTGYGFNLTYPGGSNASSGTNAIGEQLVRQVSIVGAGSYSTVNLSYYYITTLSGRRNFTALLSIVGLENNTLMGDKNTTYGLGIFERILFYTLIILFVVGIASMVGQVLPGVVLSMVVSGLMVFVGFIPLWVILPSMFISFLFVVWKSGGY